MKCTIFTAVVVAASFGLAMSASAQYQNNSKYSSYGYQPQEAPADEIQEVSPSDVPMQPKTNDEPSSVMAEQHAPMQPSALYQAPAGSSHASSSGCASSSGSAGYGGGCDSGHCGVGGGGLVRGSDRNVVFGLRGLVFERDYEDDRGLASNSLGQSLFSTDNEIDTLGGFETFIGVRNCSGIGWEFSYFGLFADRTDVTFSGAPLYTNLRGLGDLDLIGSDVAATFDTSDNYRIYRFNEIHNAEFNLLHNAGCAPTFRCGSMNVEWLAGIRWFKFSEDYRITANNFLTTYPAQTLYDLEVENNLVGVQLGARAERCLRNRLSLSLGAKFGVYNNDIYTRQSITDGNGTFATAAVGPYAGSDYALSSTKDEVATLGELDLGLNWQFAECWRANVGYRVIGVSGVALAPEQIPYNFADFDNTNRIRSNGDLLLHGAYFGVEKAF